MWVEQDPAGTYAAMLAFYPKFEFDASASDNNEWIFMVDRSSSMKGEPLEDMKRTLLATLDKLPTQGLNINVIGFGSTFERLFVDSQSTSDPRTLATARNYIEQISANYGGTELWYPLPPLPLKKEKH